MDEGMLPIAAFSSVEAHGSLCAFSTPVKMSFWYLLSCVYSFELVMEMQSCHVTSVEIPIPAPVIAPFALFASFLGL